MNDRPRLSAIDLWARRERACLEVLDDALRMLAEDPGPQDHEDDINRRLLRMIDRATHQHNQREPDEVGAVVYEGRNTPASDDAQRALREHKRPDFQWAWIDEHATDPDRARRELVLECKRIARTTGRVASCELYVSEGIRRYVSDEHGYGKGQRSGAMVGYVQRITIREALTAINAAAASDGVQALQVVAIHEDRGACLEHAFARGYPVSPFRLRHRWIRTQ